MVIRLCDLCGARIDERAVAGVLVVPVAPTADATSLAAFEQALFGRAFAQKQYEVCPGCVHGLLAGRALVLEKRDAIVPQRP